MRTRPELFQAVIATSPWLGWDDRNELKQLLPFLSGGDVKARTLFFSSANEGPDMQSDLKAVAGALRARKNDFLRWDSAEYPKETHDSVVIKAYFDALRMIFDGWPLPRDPQTNLLQGSLEDVKAHYAKLGQRLGFKPLPPEGVVNELGYQHLRLLEIDAALAAFRYNTELYPQAANVWDSLGDGLDRAGRKDEALESYRRALAIGEANNDPSVEAFRKNVLRLTNTATPSINVPR